MTLGEEKGLPGNEEATHRGSFLSNYEKSKYEAEVEAFKFKKEFEFVSSKPIFSSGTWESFWNSKIAYIFSQQKISPLLKTISQ